MNFQRLARSVGREGPIPERPVVCVQGLGFVGFAMAIAVARARDERGEPCFNTIGVELPTPEGEAKLMAMNGGRMPLANSDEHLHEALAEAHRVGNLIATTDPAAYGLASVTAVDIHLDVVSDGARPTVDFGGLRAAIRTLGEHMPLGSLVVLETTMPPGTCAKVIAPQLEETLEARGLPRDAIHLAHAYERVMPGSGYLDSIVNFWRVYAGHTPEAADMCEAFLSKVIDVERYPLTRLASTTASETGKVLENSYRATNIAFVEEWGRFGEAVGIDMFEIINAIRVRPTHSNFRQPGFGVGGYCLTKDPLLAAIGARELFDRGDLEFPFCHRAVEVNQAMPLVSLDQIEKLLGGSLEGKQILLLGVSYRPDVGDTRYSPSEIFVKEARDRGAVVHCHDSLLAEWSELKMQLPAEIPKAEGFDAVVFAVSHQAYLEMDLGGWLEDARPLIFDANEVLTRPRRSQLRQLGCRVSCIGRGEDCE